jgi:transposase
MNAMADPSIRRSIDVRAKQVVPLLKEGLLQKEIAERLGVSEAQVVKYVRHARKLGMLPPKQKQRPPSVLGRVQVGHLGAELYKLDADIQQWIAANLPDGATLTDFAVACIVDAYYQEQNEH